MYRWMFNSNTIQIAKYLEYRIFMISFSLLQIDISESENTTICIFFFKAETFLNWKKI